MPKAAVLQSAFNAGELSPLMYGRTDSPRYKQGLATCLNYIPTLQGPLQRKPGTKFCNPVKDSTKPPVLIPFTFSETQNYMLEFGENYIRFYYNNAPVVTVGTTYRMSGLKNWGDLFFASRSTTLAASSESISSTLTITNGSILEITNIYQDADLPNLRFVQNANTLYLFHPQYPVFKLQNTGASTWEFTQVYFKDGPYLDFNSYASNGDSTGISLTPTGTANIQEVVTGPKDAISGAITDPLGSGQIQITVSTALANLGYYSTMKVFINGIAGTTEANNYDLVTGSYPSHPTSWVIEVTGTYTFLLIGSTFANAYSSGGEVFPALFDDNAYAAQNGLPIPDVGRNVALIIGGIRYWGTAMGPAATYIVSRNASLLSIYMGDGEGTIVPFPGTTQATAWQMGVFGGTRTYSPAAFAGLGYPSCGTFHQNRLFMTGATSFPEDIDGSNTGDYENFAPSDPATLEVTDSNALNFTLNSTTVNKMQWICSNAQGLLGGSSSAEWAMAPSAQSEALTPTNFNAFQTSFYGSSNSEVVQAGNAAIYIQRAQRKVREMNFFFQVGTFRSTDMTEISEHITLPTITKLVFQKETQPLIWGLRSDGNLVSMIYDRTDVALTAGWTRHQLGGKSDAAGTNPIVYSMAVIPSPDTTFDQLWFVVQRYINGATVYTIEYMTKIFDDSMLQEDAFQLDCGGTYDTPVTISGISNASTAVVTANGHGFANGTQVRIVSVDGLNLSTADINGNVTISNLVNEKTFVVAGQTTNTFQLHDFSGNPISSSAYGAYVSGGQVRKLVSTVSGLTWLENETVGVLADGSWHPDCVVSNSGVLTLNYPAAKVQIGYRYASQGQLLRAEAGAADGTSIGKTRRTTRVAFMLHRVGDLSFGTDFSNLIPVKFAQGDVQQADQATPLFSGIIRDGVESSYDFESQICFEQNSPLPGCIESITSFMEEQDV